MFTLFYTVLFQTNKQLYELLYDLYLTHTRVFVCVIYNDRRVCVILGQLNNNYVGWILKHGVCYWIIFL